jgi:hypothetical protein
MTREEAFVCENGRCRLVNAEVFISLSEPQIVENTARITITIETPGHRPGRGYYETVDVTLVRHGRDWKVSNISQLGIS